MKKEIKERWIKALRSGEYQQGFFRLKFREGNKLRHCCLGVLAELGEKENKVSWKEEVMTREDQSYFRCHDKQNASLSNTRLVLSLRDWAKVEDIGGWVPLNDKTEKILAEEHSEEELEFILETIYSYKSRSATLSLVELNDAGVNFKAIARLIEEFL